MPAVRIATYNVNNLFLHGEGGEHGNTPQKTVRPLTRMIGQVDADLLVLQEVGSHQTLASLNERLADPYPHIDLLEGNSARSIHLGVMSRLPVELTSHRALVLQDQQGQPLQDYCSETQKRAGRPKPLGFYRDLLRVDVGGLSRSLSLFAVHLKSRTSRPWQTQPSEDIRSAECRMTVQVVAEFRRQHPQSLIALAGDFNDRLVSEALAPLTALELQDPLGAVLQRSGRNPSTYWSRRRMRIDHILLCRDACQLLVKDSPLIHVSRMAQTASDHYPVSLQLNLPPR